MSLYQKCLIEKIKLDRYFDVRWWNAIIWNNCKHISILINIQKCVLEKIILMKVEVVTYVMILHRKRKLIKLIRKYNNMPKIIDLIRNDILADKKSITKNELISTISNKIEKIR